MKEQTPGRFRVVIEEGPPRGDLFELEQATTFHVVDTTSGTVVMCFEGLLKAGFKDGLWDDYATSGVCEVFVAPDDESVIVRYCDGREERVPLSCC